jgi:hypothetical protein
MSEWRKYLGVTMFAAALLALPAAILMGPGIAGAAGWEKPASEAEFILQHAADRVSRWSQAFGEGVPPALSWSIAGQPIELTDNPALSLSEAAGSGNSAPPAAIDYAAELMAAWTVRRSMELPDGLRTARAGLVPAPEGLASRADLARLLDSVSRNEAGDQAIEAALVGIAAALAAQADGEQPSDAGRRQFVAAQVGDKYTNQHSGRIGAFGISLYQLAPSVRVRSVRLESDTAGSLLLGSWNAPDSTLERGRALFQAESDAGITVPAMPVPAYLIVLNPSSSRAAYDLTIKTMHVEADGTPAGQISANPNPVQVCSGSVGQTTILWAAQNVTTAEVRVGTAGGKVFAQGVSGSIAAPWITQPTLFYLVDTSEGRNLELTRILVDVSTQGCPDRASGQLAASPNPVRVCQSSRESTSLTWTTREVVNAEIRVESPSGTVVARGPSGSVQIGWITRPVIFYLLDITNGRSQLLAQLLVNVNSDGCQDPPSGAISANPATVQYCGKSAASTTLIWNSRNAKIAEVRAGSPAGAVVAAAASGTVAVPWIQGPTFFYLVDNDGGRITELARVLVEVTDEGCLLSPRGQLQASPNPVQYCGGVAGETGITWNTADVGSAEIRIGGPDGKVFARGLAGSARATFINQPTLFVLYDITGTPRQELARLLVGVSNSNCVSVR